MASAADDAMRPEGSTAVELSLRERAPLNVDESIESILAERSASKPGRFAEGMMGRGEGGLRE